MEGNGKTKPASWRKIIRGEGKKDIISHTLLYPPLLVGRRAALGRRGRARPGEQPAAAVLLLLILVLLLLLLLVLVAFETTAVPPRGRRVVCQVGSTAPTG